MHSAVRFPAVAGTFYPAEAARLRSQVVSYLSAAKPVALDFRLRALVVPHAGYVYSGPIAATGYRLLQSGDAWSRIVMLGPSHYVWFEGLALPGADLLDTPLGPVVVDSDAAAVVLASPLVVDSPVAHEREHSLEVQLPFLQVVAPGVPVVPLLTGAVAPEDAADVVEPLLDDETLLVVSSDLSHYYDSVTAHRRDAVTAAAIERCDAAALDRESACGRTGIQAALHIAKRRGYTVEALDLRNSADTAGTPERVVGYGAFAMGD